jgi:hypothetical protein
MSKNSCQVPAPCFQLEAGDWELATSIEYPANGSFFVPTHAIYKEKNGQASRLISTG